MPSVYDIVIVEFIFEDKPNVSKPRPAVVVEVEGGVATIVLAKVTGHDPRPEYPGEIALKDWAEEGLVKQSTVRCSKLVRLLESDIKVVVGHLTDRDAAAVCEGLREVATRG